MVHLRVEVSKIGDRHYAFVTSNGTASTTGSAGHIETGGFQVIDLYDPTNIQPVLSVTDNEGDFQQISVLLMMWVYFQWMAKHMLL